MHTPVQVFLSNVYVPGTLAWDTPLQLFCWIKNSGVHSRRFPQEVIVQSMKV